MDEAGVYIGKLTEQRLGVQKLSDLSLVGKERTADFVQCSDTTWPAVIPDGPKQFALYAL